MDRPVSTTPEPFGTLLGYASGVAAYSSDYDSASDDEYPKRSAFRHYVDGIYMGYKWQCVEFARRWLYLNKGYLFDDVAMAYDIFDLRSVRDINSNTRLPLQAFRNGSKQHPEPGALLIWDEGGEFEGTGHVAIVMEVLPDRLRIAEQNVGHQRWPEGQSYCRELPAQIGEEGDYWLECSYNDASILGWMLQTEDNPHAEPTPELDLGLFELKSREAKDTGQATQPWLNIANVDEAAYVKMMHGHKLTSVDRDQHRYYCLSITAQEQLEHATNELHGLFMHATDYVLDHPELLKHFNLPDAILPKIRQSWDNRLNQLITSRFDFAMSPSGLKVYEYNCDSASCYMESGKVQGKWAKQFGVKEGIDAGGSLFNELVKAWRKSKVKGLLHILHDDDPEELYHALFMQQTLKAAGIQSRIISNFEQLQWQEGSIVDAEGDVLRWVWKTWSWESALDQIRDECEAQNTEQFNPKGKTGEPPRLADVLLHPDIMVFEPLWTLIPSNKAILAVLWTLFPNHPFLLNTDFCLTEELQNSGYVTKPIVGRCGANIQLISADEAVLAETEGQFSTQSNVYQALFPLPKIDDYYVQVSTFTAAGSYAGSGVRVDASMIIGKHSDCMALRFISDEQFS